ncbi:MAG TPA: hypothetical protein VFR15_18250 [Chloroflexia bacterium]|nr:hypothetical protein [Chloroflexia bacterium]
MEHKPEQSPAHVEPERAPEPEERILTAEDREQLRRQQELGAGCGCIGYALWTVLAVIAGAVFVLGRVTALLTASSSLRADLLAGRIEADEYTRMINDIQSEQVFYIVGWLVLWIAGLGVIWLLASRGRRGVPEEEDEDEGY